MSSFGPSPVVPVSPVLDALTAPVVAVVPDSVAPVPVVGLVVTSPLLCVWPPEADAVPVVGVVSPVVGTVALAPELAVGSVALAGPTPVPVSPVEPPPLSPHPDIHPTQARPST